MFKLVSGIFSAALLAQTAMAEPLIYRDGSLLISEAAVLSDSAVAYYKNVKLAANADGGFDLVAAEARPLAGVEAVSVSVDETRAVAQITIEGYKSVPCVELEPPAVSRDGMEVSVVLAETVLGPAESCIAVIDPFTTTVDVDVSDWEKGTYTVNVNREASATFELDAEPGPSMQ